jgi:sigma-B regulation protein RsbU (phosphoserine phosphatase)
MSPEGIVRYANAGLLPLRLLGAAGPRERVHTGPFLGMIPGVGFDDVQFALEPGDRLCAYTDGMVELWSGRGERVDERALFAALASGSTVAEGMAALATRLGELRADGWAQTDDITVLAVGPRA